MAEMIDTELSLKVARIMYPEYEWSVWRDGKVSAEIMEGRLTFNYRSKTCAWDMVMWLHRGTSSDNGSRKTRMSLLAFALVMFKDDPQYALAMAIKDIGE